MYRNYYCAMRIDEDAAGRLPTEKELRKHALDNFLRDTFSFEDFKSKREAVAESVKTAPGIAFFSESWGEIGYVLTESINPYTGEGYKIVDVNTSALDMSDKVALYAR